MSLKLQYISLFEIQILHHYFLNVGSTTFSTMDNDAQLARFRNYDIRNFMEIIPTDHCLRKLKDHQLSWKASATGLLIGAKRDTENDNRPVVPLAADLKLSFGISIFDPYFSNFSELPLTRPAGTCFYFSNAAAVASAADPLNLSRAADSPDTFRYISTDDLVKLQKPLYNIELPADDQTARVQLSDFSDAGSQPVYMETINSIAPSSRNHQMDLRHLPAGHYRMQLTNNADDSLLLEDAFYLDTEKLSTRFNMLLDIHTFNETANDFALLQTSGIFKSSPRRFIIRINNRSTRWRYIFKSDQTIGADDDLVIETAGTDHILVTPSDFPLTHDGRIELNMNNEPLPNPSPHSIKAEGGMVFSEIFL